MEPLTRGDPESPLRWTCKSVRKLAGELKRRGHQASHWMVAELLHEMDYSLQGNRKTIEGTTHPDRDAQFEHINHKVEQSLAQQQPVISVDTKKKELIGDFKNEGREWRPQGQPENVRVHDFKIPELGRAAPLRRLRHGSEHGLGECRDRPRYRGVCRGEHPSLVVLNGAAGLSSGPATAHYRRCGGQQWVSRSTLEGGTAEACRRTRLAHCGMPLSTGDEQVEQD